MGDGQRLIHFKFFSPDDVRTQRETPGQKQQYDELIGEMWLVLNSAYPKDTEVLLTIELDEQHSSIQITAILKNDPSVRESCSFSRGGIDEKISHQVAAQLQELKQLDLTTYGVAEANRLVGDIMKSVNQIKDGNVAQRQDRLEEAQSKLRELEVFASKDLTTASFLLSDFQLVIGNCSQHLHDQQVSIIEEIIDRLQQILTTQNIAAIESCLTEGTRERDNLPDLIKMVLYCRIGVARAELIEPTHARSMRIKFDRLLVAMKYKDLTTASFLLSDFQLAIGNCSQHLHEQQVPIIKEIIDRLQQILTTQNIAAIESCLTEGTRERDNLPDLIKMVLYCRIGVARAELIEPTHARSMRIKFDRLLVAMKYKDLNEIDRLIEELLPDVHTYANQSTTTAQINTGIK